jgi:uncharacterized protein YkwD
MRPIIYIVLLFQFFAGYSNRYTRHFILYQQSSYYKSKVYTEQSVASFYGLREIQKKVSTDSFDIHLFDACLFFAANKLRAMHQFPPLVFDDKLQQAAAMHSYQMSEHHFFEHENTYVKKLRDPELRIRYAGVKCNGSAENCYKRSLDADEEISYIQLAQEVVEGWYHSPGHRHNLMNTQLKHMGIVTATEYLNNEMYIVVTQDFSD